VTTGGDAAVTTEQQLLPQFAAIHAADAPMHCPCVAHVAQDACESLPHATELGEATKRAVGGAVGGGWYTGLGTGAEPQQLRAQLESMKVWYELLVQNP
jgi:hypothetical protein